MNDNAEGEYSFTFTIGTPLATLLTPHQTTWVSRPIKVEMGVTEDGFADLASVRATPPLSAGESYQVRASFNGVTISQLREAGTDYPDWVTARYINLPPEISERTHELARQIADGEESTYDIVNAVTNYLRANIEYVETVPAIPANQDPVDWFLFDYQKGFCNYYASAEVVLLRSLGIPARMAVGYAQGERMEKAPDAFVIRQRDAHAWPEVYFPGIGWVEFEPTVSQPILLRPLGQQSAFGGPATSDTFPNDQSDPIEDLPLDRGAIEGAGNINLGDVVTPTTVITFSVVIVLAVIFIILMIPYLRRKRIYERLPRITIALESGIRRFGLKPPEFLVRWARLAQLSPLGRSYQEINLALSRLGKPLGLTETPSERAESLTVILPAASDPTNTLISEYHTGIYGRDNHANLEAAREAGNQIRRLSYRELLDRFIDRLREFYDGSSREQRW
jgi:transglutaminase-like putative cysteine protease